VTRVEPDFLPPSHNWHDDCFGRGGPNPTFLIESRLAGFLEADMSVGDALLGIHATALQLRSQRMSMLASNIANAATPNYKARDINFAQALRQASNGESIESSVEYRVPLQPSLDGTPSKCRRSRRRLLKMRSPIVRACPSCKVGSGR
jgi:hypothetical protein